MLAMLSKFESSADDIALFHSVEDQLFDLMRLWNNELQSASGPLALDDELRGPVISDGVSLNVKFHKPTMVQSKSEQEDSVIKRMESGLMSRKMAVMDLYEVDEEKADEIIEEIDSDMESPDEKMEPSENDSSSMIKEFESDKEKTEFSMPGNPAEWVEDEDLWEKAKSASEKAFGEIKWEFVTWWYLKHGGSKKGE
jgi:hypothetical protein